MSAKNFTLLFYYVPEDKDDVDTPNAFGIKKPVDELRLSDIKEQFPLEGQYHFRFKYKHGSEYVWLDLVNTNCKLPTVDGKVVMKATRKSWSTAGPASQQSHTNGYSNPSAKAKLLEGIDSPATVPAAGPSHVNPMSLSNERKGAGKEKKTDDFDDFLGI
eukprot:TRINITY_DN521_c0_g1_i3.p1 TRINITY_DN521_c0_g1~~TRINITY_DN521_c0_g1_i3.p1  ORF type:complete len:160 (+),score=45.95 TRINITY_DN521_c0_g1_i3:98-577(+)